MACSSACGLPRRTRRTVAPALTSWSGVQQRRRACCGFHRVLVERSSRSHGTTFSGSSIVTSPQTWQCVTGPSCAHARVPHRGPPRPTSPRWRKRGNCGGQEPTSSSSPTMSPPSPTATSLFDGPVVGRPSAVPYSFQTRARRSQGAGSQSAEGASHLCLQPRLVRERQPVMVECRCTFDALLAISGASEEAIRSQRTKSPTKVHGKHLNVSTSVSSPTASSYSFREMHVRACSNWLVAVSAIG